MAASGLFRLTSTFEQGFKKEDVLAYVDDLTNKNAKLEEEKKALEEAASTSTGIDKAALDKMEEEKRILKEQLDDANAQIEKQESLLAGEKSVREKLQKQFAEEKQRLMAELAKASSSSGEAETLMEQIKERDEEIENLIEKIKKQDSEIAEKGNILIQKETEISKLNAEITELKENADGGVQSTVDIQNVFIEAQNTVKKLTSQAQKEADKRIADAEAEAERIISEANEVADKTIKDANKKADDIVVNAETAVTEKCRNANEKSDAVIRMTNDIKSFVTNDINDISGDIKKITDMLNQLNNDVTSKINAANEKLARAGSVINDDKKLGEFIEKINFENNEMNIEIETINAVKTIPDVTPDEEKNIEEPAAEKVIKEEPPKKDKKENKKNMKISAQDWGIDLEAITKQIEEEESTKTKLEEE